MDIEEIQLIKQSIEADLLKLPGVTGVDVGYKEVGGNKTDILAIRVYVQIKRKEVPPEEMIPEQIQGVPTDVIQRTFVLH